MVETSKRCSTQPCLRGGHSRPNFNQRLSLYSLLLLLSTPTAIFAQSCALYDPPVPGLTCLHGGQALNAVTDSRTSWMVEFYSSWCGHCQHFAPAMKDLGKEVRPWNSVIRIGVLECTESKENQDICSKFDVRAYPTIRFFKPNDHTPLEYSNKIVGSRSVEAVRRLMVDHVSSLSEQPDNWPDLQPLQDDTFLSISPADWKPTVLIFDDDSSYVGKELILDLLSSKSVTIHRVSPANTALTRHYSVLEFPTMVVEFEKDDFHVVDGHSFKNPRKQFHEALISHLNKFNIKRKRNKKVHAPAPAHVSQTPPIGLHPSPPKVNEHSKVYASAVQEPQTPPTSTARINRVHLDDLLGAVSYALRKEVSIHNIVSGSAFSALTRFIRLLESAFSSALPAASEVMSQVRTKVESRASTGFIINRDWQRVLETRLDTQLFPEKPRWKNCNGSLPRYRGYPCGLWMLMHTVTILTLPTHSSLDGAFTSKEALLVLSTFVRNFFSCEVCRVHFTEMALTINQGGITHDGDAVLWLWEAHNVVNKRLKGSISSDPAYPKAMFPSYQVCPYCYEQGTSPRDTVNDTQVSLTIDHPGFNNTKFSTGESLVSVFMSSNTNVAMAMDKNADSTKHVWNRTAVLLYLWNFYHLAGNKSGRGHRHVSSRRVLHAAWPKLYKNVDRLHHKFYGLGKGGMHYSDHTGLGFNHVDTGICFMSYVMCVLFLAVIAYLLLKRRRLRKLFLS